MSVVLITGTSSGFGLLMAARLAASDHMIYATMRSLGKQDDLLAEVGRRGGEVAILQLDVRDDASIKRCIAHIAAKEGRLDILINNAGYGIGGFFEDLSEDEIREQMETNFYGTLKVTRQALPLMRKTRADSGKRGAVKIINISSVGGRTGTPGMGAYNASKYALEGHSESLFHELRPFGISVVVIEPGTFRTKIFTENLKLARRAEDASSPYSHYGHRLKQILQQRITQGRGWGMGEAEDVAKLVERTIAARNPRFRYVIGTVARFRLALQWLLPFRWYAALVQRVALGKGKVH
jgi:NAD(P)-dependent dehydrogenase (short-subunit alcohol dehydrogenase family)